MKQLSVILILLYLGFPAVSQITIDQSECPFPEDTLYFDAMADLTTATPTRGANQTWDYSNLVFPGAIISSAYDTVINDTHFPTAKFSRARQFKGMTFFLGYYYTRYNDINSNGYEQVGMKVQETHYPIGMLTGNSGDTLSILESYINHSSTPRTFLKFPATYGSAWSAILRFEVDMQITLNSASLFKAPMKQVYYLHKRDSVVGWGTLKTPVIAGHESEFPALLLQTIEYTVDSFYLNGQPAPANLLSQFGMAQGQITSPTNYTLQFYREGLFGYQLSLYYTDSTFTALDTTTGSVWFNRDLPLATNIKQVDKENVDATSFPNPVTGQSFYLYHSDGKEIDQVMLYSLTGKTIKCQTDAAPNQSKVTVQENMANGMYIYKAFDRSANLIATGKITFFR